MDIKINDKTFPKDDLLKFIGKSKLQAIMHLRSMVNIGLKDAKEIVENLEQNPNYYDNTVPNITERDVAEGETISFNSTNTNNIPFHQNSDKKVAPHIITNKNSNKKWMYAIGIIFIITLLYFLMKEGVLSN